jgi:RHS repeat-associated protein
MIVAQENTSVPKKVLIGKIFALPNGHYYPFGKESRSSATVNKPAESFTGHQLDVESSLIYAGARYYNPQIARWITVDPDDEKYPSWSPYNYAENDPVSMLDPTGRGPGWFIRAIKGGWKRVSRRRALEETKNLGDVVAEGRGSSKAAKKLRKDARVDKKTVRSDGDLLENGEVGMPHYQNKTGKKGHTFYKAGAAAGAAAGETGEAAAESSSDSPSKASEVLEAVAEVVSDLLNEVLTLGLSDPEHNRPGGFGNQGQDVDGDGEDDAFDEIDNRPKEEKKEEQDPKKTEDN